MSDENNTPQGGGEALPASTTAAPAAAEPAAKPVPKSDGEAALLEAEAPAQPEADDAAKKAAEAKAEQERIEKKKNRTREYINRINAENAELRRRVAEREAAQPQPVTHQRQPATAEGEPTLEDHNFNVAEFQRAHSAWAVKNALEAERTKTQQAESTQQQQKVVDTYNERIADFADDHPDFPEVVGSIAYPLSAEIQLAIMAHEKGAEIAYHLGNNDDDAFSLASIQPHLAAAAVERLASRLTAAPSPVPTQAAPTQPIQPKPISSAPPPVPSVSGRSPTETPPEKLTDDEWYKREAERNRKR